MNYSNISIAAVVIIILVGALYQLLKFNPKSKATIPLQRPEFLRVGGRLIDANEWSPQVLESIRKEYFRPNVKEKYLVTLDLTATCPRTHATRDRIALIAKDLAASKDLTAGLLRSRAEIQCGECGKRARISGKSVVWEGPVENWDGAL